MSSLSLSQKLAALKAKQESRNNISATSNNTSTVPAKLLLKLYLTHSRVLRLNYFLGLKLFKRWLNVADIVTPVDYIPYELHRCLVTWDIIELAKIFNCPACLMYDTVVELINENDSHE